MTLYCEPETEIAVGMGEGAAVDMVIVVLDTPEASTVMGVTIAVAIASMRGIRSWQMIVRVAVM